MITWKNSFNRLNEEYGIVKKKKQALDSLFEKGKISKSTYESFNSEIIAAIADIEKQQQELAQKMQSKTQELQNQIKTLEILLANYEIQYAAGEIDDNIYQLEINLLGNGLEVARNELGTVQDAVNQLCATSAPKLEPVISAAPKVTPESSVEAEVAAPESVVEEPVAEAPVMEEAAVESSVEAEVAAPESETVEKKAPLGEFEVESSEAVQRDLTQIVEEINPEYPFEAPIKAQENVNDDAIHEVCVETPQMSIHNVKETLPEAYSDNDYSDNDEEKE